MKTLLTAVAACLAGALHAQIHAYQWAHQWGSTGQDFAYEAVFDPAGNTIVVGDFHGTIDGDAGAGVNALTSAGANDGFVVKLDTAGEHLWSYRFGSTLEDRAMAVGTDAQGNVVATGIFSGTVDFDPGTGVFPLTSTGNQDVFILKLAADGSFVWARNIGSIYSDECYTVSVDAAGEVFVTGLVSEAADLDPGPANYPFAGGEFLLKLDADGQFMWALHPFTGGGTVFRTCLNAVGDLFLTGSAGAGDFDPGPGTFNLNGGGNSDIFVTKLNTDGGFIWARLLGGPDNEQGSGIAVDSSDNVYVTGWFRSGCDFDPGVSDTTLTTVNGADVFVLRLNADGTFAWVFQEGGGTFSADEGFGIAVDGQGLVYITGQILGTTDMDPGPGSLIFNTGSTNAIFVQCVQADATFEWAFTVAAGPFFYNTGRSIHSDAQGNLRIAGQFQGANVDFDPGTGVHTMSVAGIDDAFVLALGPDVSTGIATTRNMVSGVFPVPATERVFFGERLSGSVVDDRGMRMQDVLNANSLSVAGWPAGLYVLRCADGRVLRFVVE